MRVSDWLSQKFPSAEYELPRINDAYYEHLIRMYRSRATLFRNVGIGCLLASFPIVLFGIVIFWVGDPADSKRAASEIELSVELSVLRRRLSEIGTTGAKTLAEVAITERASMLANLFGRVAPTIKAASESDSGSIARGKLLLHTVKRILEALADPNLAATEAVKENPRDAIVNVQDWSPGDSNRFPRQSLLLIREELGQQGEPLDAIHEGIGKLEKLIQLATNQSISEAKSMLESQYLTLLNSVDTAIRKKHEDSKQKLVTFQRESPFREEERQSIQSNIEAVEKQLTEVRSERDKILFMSWVPGLTLRVGIVVLLLFFSQVLLSAYRYTISLSSFYLARADAIQLLQPQSGRDFWYDINQLSALIKNLSPNTNDLSIDTVISPNEQLTNLATAWMSRK